MGQKMGLNIDITVGLRFVGGKVKGDTNTHIYEVLRMGQERL